jgi:hypothetical protein
MHFVLAHQVARDRAAQAVKDAPDGWVVRITKPTRTLEQNALIHPVCRQIRKYMVAHGAPKKSEEWWRYYLVAKWAGNEVMQDPDGSGGIVVIPKHAGTSGLSKEEASEFIEWAYAFGANIGVEFDGR